jgi:hypothetical protein
MNRSIFYHVYILISLCLVQTEACVLKSLIWASDVILYENYFKFCFIA